MTPLPSGPWKKVDIDFAGPFGSRMALVLWDQYSRMPIVEFVSTTSVECVVPRLEKIFTTYGVPEEIKSDNAPPFNGKRFADYDEEQGFKHHKVTPKTKHVRSLLEKRCSYSQNDSVFCRLKVWMLTWCGGGRDKISGTNVTCRHIVLEWSLTLGNAIFEILLRMRLS